MADWQGLEIKLPVEELVEQAREGLETLMGFLEIIKALLETISLFLVDFSNPVSVLVQVLSALITQFFESLRQTGLYGYFDFPDPTVDPNFDHFRGGYQAFTERFKGSLYDSRDPFRPQPLAGSTLSGFTLIVADVASVYELMRVVAILRLFFGKDFATAAYTAPANVRVVPIGSKNEPILRVPSLFGADIQGLAVEWSLATNQFPPDPGFSDLVATVSSELIPQKWLIEKTSRQGGPELLYQEVTTNYLDRDGAPIKRQERVRDESGDVFRKFEAYIVVDASTETSTYLLGQLGTFRYLDKEVVKDKTYYYRVRAISGELDLSGTTLNLAAPVVNTNRNNETTQYWPSANSSNKVVMGRPSPTVSGILPTIPKDMDIIQVLEDVYKMAFSLGFQLPGLDSDTFGADGRNTGNTPTYDIGLGSLTNIAGPVSLINATYGDPEGVTFSDKGRVTSAEYDEVNKEYPNVIHNYYVVKHYARKLALATAMALYTSGEGLVSFRNLVKGPAPYPVPAKVGQGFFDSNTDTIEGQAHQFNILFTNNFPKVYSPLVYETNHFAYNNANVRLNLLRAVSFLKAFSLGGTKPDWVSISLLQDVVPWTGKYLYELKARIDALLDAYRAALEELKAFITLIESKINSLERFIQFLLEILSYLENFSAGFYFLSVPSTDKGIPGWIEAIDTAGGTKPTSGPGGYSAGVGLAYAGPNVDAFVTAFSLIF